MDAWPAASPDLLSNPTHLVRLEIMAITAFTRQAAATLLCSAPCMRVQHALPSIPTHAMVHQQSAALSSVRQMRSLQFPREHDRGSKLSLPLLMLMCAHLCLTF